MVALMLLTGACSDGGPVPSSGNQDVIPARATPTADFLIEPAATPTAILSESPTISVPKATATPELPAPPTPIESTDPTRYNAVVQVTTAQRHPISPLIYGISVSTGQHEELLQWMGVTLVRWGGNARTRHNWEVNASNAGSDWEFRNIGQGDSTPGSASVQFLQRNLQLGAWSLLTIPTIGWVAKDGSNDSVSIGMPEHGGPPVAPGSDAAFTKFENGVWTAPYDPAANRARTSVQSLPSKDAPFSYPPNLNDDKVYQDEWVAYLKSVRPADAPPMIYAMDNEPDLWADDTHVDVHPVRMGYDDTLSNFLTYARAVKKVDPSGLIAGPESWGVTAYTFSALDEGGDGYGTAHDRAAHGNVPFLQWFLRSTHKSDQEQGARSLDVLDIHYYPNAGQYSGNNSPEMQEKRMQAPRALWDTMYVEPSWVARTEWGHLALIRRLNKLIEQEYPGTKLGISEWNFGGEDDISGAIANADAFGIFGREGLYMATYWGLPEMGSPTGWAYRMYRNYDGNGATFGSESIDTTTSDKENLSAYGALNEDGSKLTVMLINKDMQRTADVTVSPADFSAASPGTQYMYSPSDLTTIQNAPLTVTDGSAHVSLPPTSILLLVMDKK
jgi:hypothetical protein